METVTTNASSVSHVDTETNYEDEFEELKCIGRGNFGAAFLVKFKNSPPDQQDKYFVAKKIILG